MQTFGMLGALLAAVGVGVAPSAAFGFESSAQYAQNIYLQQPKLDLPSSLINAAPAVNQQKTPSTGSVDKQSGVEKKSNSKAKNRIESNEDSKKEKKQKKKKGKKDKRNKKSPAAESSRQPKQGKKRRRTSLALQKPTLLCRSFKKNDKSVRGFRARLYGRNAASVASGLSSNLNAYQSSGGNLSRCIFTGVISPSAFTKYFANRKPTALIRSSDNYSLPVYSSYAKLFAASGGRRSRFGLIATTPSLKGSNGSRKMLRINANNALILFVDSRNQSVFKAPPSPLPLRLINVSPKVSEVLTDASKSSLRSIIDFKKRKRTTGKQSSLSVYEGDARQASDLKSFSPQGLQSIGLLSAWDSVQIASLDHGLSRLLGYPQILLAEVDPQIAEYCMDAQDFSGCVETMQGSADSVSPGTDASSSEYGEGEDDSEYLGNEYGEGEDDSEYLGNEYGEGEDDSEYLGNEYGEDDSEYLGEEYAEGEVDDDEFYEGSEMYPEDMGAPTAQACTGDTFGEQLACALISALSTLLQQAFASN